MRRMSVDRRMDFPLRDRGEPDIGFAAQHRRSLTGITELRFACGRVLRPASSSAPVDLGAADFAQSTAFKRALDREMTAGCP